ncbi:ketosynthase [Stenotrophomonas sp. MYb238]|uniref:ketosynthase n=1 Tax=Stenotrophomonas sp. MYb238 TaxID=2040281 RepID=UPI001291ECB8|nr:ketosynthase [Stenotrophomonas sp. MYb238]MQP76200.1 ketosynthase [Stenotrophomonas sp. MYb238]
MDEAGHAPGHGSAASVLRIALLLAYPVLSHVASVRNEGGWAALALFGLVLLCLLDALARRRTAAWAALLASALLLAWLGRSPWAWMLLLAPPVVFPLLVAWGFARSLRPGRTALITRIVQALHARAGVPVDARLERYTRRLTAAWALLLALLAAINLALAMSAVPDGLLAAFGWQPRWPLSHTQWSWCANVADWGLIGGFLVAEYALRCRLFPQRPYRSAGQFVRQMGQLGPAFWRDLLR